MLDFAALPPEVNSGRMYAGAGAGPLMAAATAWDGLASELGSAAASYQGLVSELTGGPWAGPSATAMAAAAAPYVAWMTTTATQAEVTAGQVRAAAAAYEAAFTATVPPTVIAANRTLLMSLVATNFLGQNTPAIAANEAQYAEMWAQDATAMYGYAGASAAAATLTPFSPAPQNTNAAGAGNQAAAAAQTSGSGGASQAVSAVPSALQAMASGAQTTDPVTSILDWLYSPLGVALNNFFSAGALPVTNLTGPMFAASGALYQVTPLFNAGLAQWSAAVHGVSDAVVVPEGALTTLGDSFASSAAVSGAASAGGAGVSAGLGEAASVGALSVPQSWGTAAPEIRLASAATALPAAGSAGTPAVGAGAPGMFGGVPPIGSVVNTPRGGDPNSRHRARAKVVAALPGECGVHDDAATRWGAADRVTRVMGEDPLSAREREELATLREELADLAMERDAVARLLREAMRS